MLGLTPLVEPLSIDEAFLDLNGCEGANGAGAAETLARFARRVEREVGVTVSVGLSYCKFLAKMASDLDKPRGFALIRREEAKAWLAPQGVGRLWGVGKAGEQRLERLGFRLIGDLQRVDEWTAAARLGEDGRRLWRLAHGIDARRVSPDRETKSISSETTFDARRQRPGATDAGAARPLRPGGGAAAEGGARRRRRHAQAAPARFQPAHPQPGGPQADPARAKPVRRRPARFSTRSPRARPTG